MANRLYPPLILGALRRLNYPVLRPAALPPTRHQHTMPPIKYISQVEATQIDEELMSDDGAFALEQLMELAGLACAQTLSTVYPPSTHPRVLVCSGPGNQGGDGLVAARHLRQFGHRVVVFLPKPGGKEIYKRLRKQCENTEIEILQSEDEFVGAWKDGKGFDVVMDAIFGFSFHPPVRPPFATLLRALQASPTPVVSIDIPSGWDVEQGPRPLEDTEGAQIDVLDPEVLLSLTAPKRGVRSFRVKGWDGAKKTRYRHFLGGRFVPPAVAAKYDLQLPPYPGIEQIVELDAGEGEPSRM